MRALLTLVGVLVLVGCTDFAALQRDCVSRGDCAGGAVPPTVTETSPENQATEVRVGTSLTLRFSRAMEPASVTLAVAPPVALGAPSWADENVSLTVQPQTSLATMTRYSLVLTGRAADGVPLASGTSFSFTTEAAPDVMPPTLSASTPATAAMNVSLDTALSFTFSEPMSTASIVVTTRPALGLGEGTWSTDGRTVTWLTPGPLQPNTAYTLTVDGVDRAGNALSSAGPITFTTTTPPDTEPPAVVGTTPAAGATGVQTNRAPSLSFSEQMDVAATKAAISVSPDAGIVVTTDTGVGATQFTLTHATPFASNTPFEVTVGTGARDLAGNRLVQPFTFTFTTGATADTTPPTIVSVTPTTQSQGVAFRPTLRIVFSEAMDPSATQQALSVSAPTGVTGMPSWSMGNTHLEWTFGADLPAGTQVRWQVSTAAKDLAGNSLSQTSLYEFKVRQRFTRVLDTAQVLDASSVVKDQDSGDFQLATELRVGDVKMAFQNERAYRSILTFSLQTLPPDLIDVESARLRLTLGPPQGFALSDPDVVVQTFRQTLPVTEANAESLFNVTPAALLCTTCTPGSERYDVPFFSKPFTTQPQEKELLPFVAPVLARGAATSIQFRVLLRSGTAYPESVFPAASSDNVELVASPASSTNRPQLTIDYTGP